MSTRTMFQAQTKKMPKRKKVGTHAPPGMERNTARRKGQKNLTAKEKTADEHADDKKSRFKARGKEKHSPEFMHKDGHLRGSKKNQRKGVQGRKK